MGLKRNLALVLPPLALALAACPESQPDLPPLQAVLPIEADLPYQVNRDCGCLRDGECVVLEQIPGYGQVRNLSCRWLRPNRVARCRFEERFVEHYVDARGKSSEAPTPWRRRSLRAILLPDGRWCAG